MTISILCGGSGTRLFPLSRELMPKQFADILPSNQGQSHSLFQETLLRNAFLIKEHNAQFQVITNDNHYFIAQEQAQKCDIPLQDFILESYGKNTAPALTFAALCVLESYELDKIADDIILALPSDHLIKNTQNYQDSIKQYRLWLH